MKKELGTKKKKLKGKKIFPSGFVLDYSKFTYNPELDKYDNVVLFPEKMAKGKEAIKHPSLKKLMDSIDALKDKESK